MKSFQTLLIAIMGVIIGVLITDKLKSQPKSRSVDDLLPPHPSYFETLTDVFQFVNQSLRKGVRSDLTELEAEHVRETLVARVSEIRRFLIEERMKNES